MCLCACEVLTRYWAARYCSCRTCSRACPRSPVRSSSAGGASRAAVRGFLRARPQARLFALLLGARLALLVSFRSATRDAARGFLRASPQSRLPVALLEAFLALLAACQAGEAHDNVLECRASAWRNLIGVATGRQKCPSPRSQIRKGEGGSKQ